MRALAGVPPSVDSIVRICVHVSSGCLLLPFSSGLGLNSSNKHLLRTPYVPGTASVHLTCIVDFILVIVCD